MATTKRERQRANRELRQAELKKQNSRASMKTRAIRWSKIGLLIIVLFVLSNLIFNRTADEPTPTSTTLVETTLAP